MAYIGLDKIIEAEREDFVANLFTGSGYTYTAYHRAFLNQKSNGVIPEIQVAGTEKYKEVLLDTKVAAHSFFVVRPDIEIVGGGVFRARVDIYFAVNLDTLYSSTVTERAVEYLHRDVSEQLKRGRFVLDHLVTGLEAFADFDLVKGGDNMEPFYLAKFETEVEYQYNEC